MPKVTLIIPPNPFLEDEKRNCPLGILYVAAGMEQQDYEVAISDLRGIAAADWAWPEADMYGITCTTPEWPYVQQIAERLEGQPVIIGGAHASAYLGKQKPQTRSVVVGEGEHCTWQAIACRPGTVLTGMANTLDDIPMPARHLLPAETIVSTRLCHPGAKATTIIASRGCPFSCTYCGSPKLWNRVVRRQKPERVLAEVDRLVADYGVEELRFQDDEMNLSGEWLQALRPLADRVAFRCNARAECGNWAELRAAGCYEVGIGLETVLPSAHRTHKRTAIERTHEGIWKAHRAGLEVRLFLILGLPGDDGPVADRTIAFLESLPPLAGVHVNAFQPYPGSEIGDNLEKWGLESISWGSILAQDGVPALPEALQGEYRRLRDYTRERGWNLN